MKKINLLMACMAMFLMMSCGDDEPEDPMAEVTNEESAEIVANALANDIMSISNNQGGIGFSSVEANTGGRTETALECGVTAEESYSNTIGNDNFTLSNQITYTSTLTCVRSIPIQLDASYTASSSAESLRISSTRTSSGTSVIAIDTENLGNFLFSASLESNGSINVKRDDDRSWTTSSVLTVTNLSISTDFIRSVLAQQVPSGNLIASGSGSYTGTVTNAQGDSRTIAASITFNGDGTAEIIINGEAYEVDLNTGQLL